MRSSRVGIWFLAAAVAAAAGCMSSAKSRRSDPPPEEAAAEAPEVVAVVTARSLNVRGGPGPEHPVTGKLARGARVRVLEEDGAWRRVRLAEGGAEGWVSSAYLAVE